MKLAFAAVLLVLTAILIIQNTDVVTIRFLMWQAQMSRVLLLLITFLMGLLIGFVGAKLPAGRKSRSD